MKKSVTILTGDPVVEVVGSMDIHWLGVAAMGRWVQTHRPECLPDGVEGDFGLPHVDMLFPHDRRDGSRELSGNELLVELAGRKCYDSFGLKAGKKSNGEYIEHTQGGAVPHASILYHAKIALFFAGISRRVSHEIIRNYVGADRDEEGSPSQESTRFTHHYGFFVCPPRRLGYPMRVDDFTKKMQRAYDGYCEYVEEQVRQFEHEHGKPPTSLDRKRIYEDASSELPHQAETSFIWTTNPMAIAKFVRERADNSADLEIQRFARKYASVVVNKFPNLFPQPWMKVFRN